MDWKYLLPSIMILVGVFAGWLLNELSYYFRCRRDDKRKLKEVLYNLLEVWHLIKINNPAYTVDIMIELLENKYPEIKDNKNISTVLKPIFQKIVLDLTPQNSSQTLEKIYNRYQSAIDSLSYIDPLLAYRLSGKQDINDYLKNLNNNFEKVKNTILNIDATTSTDKINTIKSSLEPLLVKRVIKYFEDDISQISTKISILTWLKIRRKLNRSHRDIISDINKVIDPWLSKLEKELKSGKDTVTNNREITK